MLLTIDETPAALTYLARWAYVRNVVWWRATLRKFGVCDRAELQARQR